jgi:glycosyltransferase involved in cell wall biosynthesis
MLRLRRTKYAKYQQHIKVICLEHDYEAVSALIGSSMFSVNFSTKEGWEHRRAESMLKGVPSISSDAGGLPKQGADGEGGMVAEMENMDEELDRIADEITSDILHPDKHKERKDATRRWAEDYIIPELTTVPNIIREARILNGKGDRTWKIKDILEVRAANTELEEIAA